MTLSSTRQYKTYEEFDAAVKKTIYYVTKWTDVATVISQRVARDVAPKPLMSIMYEGCMESGKDVSAGGAMYNYGPGVVWTGLATYADSMAAIKKLVFDDRKYTLTQLCEGLKADFVGYEQMPPPTAARPGRPSPTASAPARAPTTGDPPPSSSPCPSCPTTP